MSAATAWNLIGLTGAGALGGGIWAQWGAPWAFMAWGGLLLGLAALRGFMSSRRTG